MANLSTNYLGLELPGPVIVSSSPLTASAEKVALLEQHGAGAVVLKSVFEEQILGESSSLGRYCDFPEAADYLRNYVGDDYLRGHIALIGQCKRTVRIPVIASINCLTSGAWTDYAERIEGAGADALEANIFFQPTDADASAAQIEARYLEVVERLTERLSIPVSVKLGMRFTNVLSIARQIYYRKGRGVVMYNRFFEPDIDIENLSLTASDPLSSPDELRNALRMVGLCSALEPHLDVAVSTGVHSGGDAVKAILAGAKAVQVCSTVYENGLGVIGQINDFVGQWMARHNFGGIGQFRGLMNYRGSSDPELYQRVQFMKYFPQ